MQAKGKVNEYQCERKKIYTITLANGAIPFMLGIGRERYYDTHKSCFIGSFVVTYVWFRPTANVFKELNVSTKDHIVRGGLILGDLGQIDQIKDDPVELNWSAAMIYS